MVYHTLESSLLDSGQWAEIICKGNGHSRLCESPISMGQIDVLITRQHRADVFLDEVNSLGLGLGLGLGG